MAYKGIPKYLLNKFCFDFWSLDMKKLFIKMISTSFLTRFNSTLNIKKFMKSEIVIWISLGLYAFFGLWHNSAYSCGYYIIRCALQKYFFYIESNITLTIFKLSKKCWIFNKNGWKVRRGSIIWLVLLFVHFRLFYFYNCIFNHSLFRRNDDFW